ncbi:MAG: hypothetical protein JJU36_13895 [Phycisphaeraceae bacterium]|nr:hypothetical protein [Phycisphaeraceae bacterium]
MPTCNIDSRGRRVRLLGGLFCGVVGIGVLVAALLGTGRDGGVGTWAWWVGGGFLAGAAFTIYEARAGWCALRAMGIRTPI